MTFRSGFLYAQRFLFPPTHGGAAKLTNGQRSVFGAMLCIGISLIPLVAVLVISDGMIEGITGRMIGLSTQDICVRINPHSEQVSFYEDFASLSERMLSVEGITASYPEMQGMALATGQKSRVGATVRAVPQDIFKLNKSFASLFEVLDGEADLSEARNAVLGQKIASDLGVVAGDKIRLISINKIGDLMTPKVSQFTVKGIVSSGYQELDALWVFIPLQTGYSVLAAKSSQFLIGLATNDAFSPELMRIKSAVEENLSGYIEGSESVEYASVFTWDEMNASEYENFASTKVLLLLIMLLIVLVASVNISSALVMVSMERRREIALLKSVGGSSEGITMSFLVVGFAAGLGGVITGIPLGLLCAVNINSILKVMEKLLNICIKFVYLISSMDVSNYKSIHLLDPAYYLQNIPISIPFMELLVITIGTLALSLLAAVLPALKAGREKPIDTLRKM